jgi:hypothetical protein
MLNLKQDIILSRTKVYVFIMNNDNLTKIQCVFNNIVKKYKIS